MIVTPLNYEGVIEALQKEQFLSLDTETFGLGWDDEMFSIIIGGADDAYYFNFNDSPDHLGRVAPVICPLGVRDHMRMKLFEQSEDRIWFMHNAKFDLRRVGMLTGHVHDTEVTARLLRNDHLEYSLDAVAKRYGFEKSDAVEKYIQEHKLYEIVQIPGKKKREKNKHFWKVPFEVMAPYGCTDAVITRQIGMRQLDELSLLK